MSIAQCALPLILRHIDIKPDLLTIMDFVDSRERVAEEIVQGVLYIQQQMSQENYQDVLRDHLKKGDLFINLSCGGGSLSMIEWSRHHGVLYSDSYTGTWDTQESSETFYSRRQLLQDVVKL